MKPLLSWRAPDPSGRIFGSLIVDPSTAAFVIFPMALHLRNENGEPKSMKFCLSGMFMKNIVDGKSYGTIEELKQLAEDSTRLWAKEVGIKLLKQIEETIYWPVEAMEESVEDIAEHCDCCAMKPGAQVFSFATALRTPYEYYVWDARPELEFKARLHGPFATEEEATAKAAELNGGAS